MKYKYHIYIPLLAGVLALASCWDENGAMDATPSGDYLRTADVVAAGSSTQASIHIEANCYWSIATTDGWLSLGASSGEGTGDVAVTMTQNPSSATDRTATVTLTSAGGISTTLTVRQEKNVEQIIVTPSELEFAAADAGYQEFTVTANGHWSVTGCPEWVGLSATEGTNTGSVQVRVTENKQEDSRPAATLTVTGDGGASATVTIRQQGRSAILTATPQRISASALGERKTLTVTGNVTWHLSTAHDWLTSFSAVSGTGTLEVAFSCQPNTTLQERTDTITVTSENKRQVVKVVVTQEAGRLPVLGQLLLIDSDERQASFIGSVTESMFAITEYGVCYGEAALPTTASKKVIVGQSAPSGDGTFEATVSGLEKGKAYHARAYAVSATGTAYSDELDFVALPMPKNDDNDRPAFGRKK